MTAQLSASQASAIDSAGKRFNVDPRLIEAVYGKESTFGSNPLGIGETNPFWAFGLIAGPGAYNGTGYVSTSNTFGDAANTVAAYIASERAAFDKGHDAGESFLQFFDGIYSPPSENPDSLANLTKIFSDLGGDAKGEAAYPGGNIWNPADPKNIYNPKNWHFLNPTDPNNYADLSGAIGNLQNAANDWIFYATAAALSLALIGGGIAIMAGGADKDPTIRTATEGAALL